MKAIAGKPQKKQVAETQSNPLIYVVGVSWPYCVLALKKFTHASPRMVSAFVLAK